MTNPSTRAKFKGAILALDLARVIGWALGPPGKRPEFGHRELGPPSSTRAFLYRNFREWLDTTGPRADLIVFESPMLPMHVQGNTRVETIKLLLGLCEHLEEWAYNRIELREARVATIRRHFIGGNVKSAIAKDRTIRRCHALGWNVATSDEADALALWDMQGCLLRPDLAAHSAELFSIGR